MATYYGYSTLNSTFSSRTLTDSELAKRDLMNHFYTRKGERVINPEFGSIVWDLVFDPLDSMTEEAVHEDVERIVNSDPRWKPLETLVTKPDDHTLRIQVRLEYISTGTAEELYLNFVGEIE